ncbi:coiled-coil domain-containing protein 25 isoform X1 [Anser cygnoides]|uniref:coiled-coil domain-containing protein 25 isoform X1 n=1 Tax=Anser cygnoides TaxID=8845 RepID=UPI0034D1CED2
MRNPLSGFTIPARRRMRTAQSNSSGTALRMRRRAARLRAARFRPPSVGAGGSGRRRRRRCHGVLLHLRRFHVDKLSSAHVYLRLHKGQTVEDIPKEVLIDCAHLVKANSIQGCKMNNVNVVYTPWTNLKKTADMDVGQIGFHRQKDVKMLMVEKKVNEILNRLEKTKVERFPDLAAEKEARDREERNEKKAQIQEMKRKEKEEMKKKKELEELRSYSSLMKAENMSSNQDGNDSDDFM